MAGPQQAEKRSSHFALAKAPDWKYTPKKPNKGVPIPYITISYFNEAVNTAGQSNGRTHDYFISTSRVPKSHNGEAGMGKGVKSGTYTDEFEPTEWSQTLQIDQGLAVFDQHMGTINKGNAPAKVYTGVTVAAAVADKACWEQMKTNTSALAITTKDKMFADPAGCGKDVVSGAWGKITGDVGAAGDMLGSVWGGIKGFFSDPLGSLSSAVDGLKKFGSKAVEAGKQVVGVVDDLRTGKLTMQDILDFAADMAQDQLCAMAAEIEKMVKEGKGCQAVGILVAEAAETIALSIATAGVGGAATKGAQMLAKMGIGKGDDIASAIAKWKKYKKSKKDGDGPPTKKPKTPDNKDSHTPKDGNNPDVCPLCPKLGNPVNPVLGVKVQSEESELDFNLPAPFQMPWQRSYVSSNAHVGWLGQGWTLPIALFVERRKARHDDMYFYVDEFGREVPFPVVPEGSSTFNRYEQITLTAVSNRKLEIKSSDGGVRYLFAPLGIDAADPRGERGKRNKRFVLVGIVDRNDLVTRITYGNAGLPQYIYDSAGRTLGLGFQGLETDGTAEKTSRTKGSPIRLTRVAEMRWARAGNANAAPGTTISEGVEIIDLVRYEYSDQGDLIAVRNRVGDLTRQLRYENHILVEHNQPGGVGWRYEYDNNANQPHPKSRVTLSASTLGERYAFEYHATETLVEDQLGRQSRYLISLDSDNRRRWGGTIDALGGPSLRGLDEWGNIVSLTDPAGRQTDYRYDGAGNPVSISTPGSVALDRAVTSIQYDPTWNLPRSLTDAEGGTTTLTYDDKGNLTAMTDAGGGVTQYKLDERGLITCITDPIGKTKLLEYNRAGQAVRYVDCSGNATQYAYDEHGYLASVLDALGHLTAYQHDVLGRLLSVRHPDSSSEAFEYDNLGRLIAYTDPLGAKTQYALAPDGLPLTRTNALGHTLQYEYDGARRLQTLINENNARYNFAYDPLDRLIEETGFDGRTTRHAYDASGLPTQKLELGMLDAAQREALRIRGETNGPNSGVPAAQIPSQRTAPTFEDPWGLGADPIDLAAHRLPSGAIHTRYSRDAAGRLAEKLIARAGFRETQPAAHQEAAETAPQVLHTRYQYDLLGRLTQTVNDGGSKIELAYDALSQIITERSYCKGEPVSLTHTYDALGNRTHTKLPTGETLNHLFYGSGHLHQINLDGEVIADIERDALYRETQRTQGSLTSRYAYDAMGRLQAQGAYRNEERNSASGSSSVTNAGMRAKAPRAGRWEALGDIDPKTPQSGAAAKGPAILARRYDYDAAGNLKQIQDQRNGAINYRYDPIGRILGAVQKNLSETFAFDPAHNIVDVDVGSQSANAAIPAAQNPLVSGNISAKVAPKAAAQGSNASTGYVNANNRLEVFEDKRYRYDSHGNLIEKRIGKHTIISMEWDVEHQLRKSIVTRNASDPKHKIAQTTHYAYDAFGRRVAKRDKFGETHFVWDGNRLLSETRGSRTLTYLYEPDSFAPLAQIEHQAGKTPIVRTDGTHEGWQEDRPSGTIPAVQVEAGHSNEADKDATALATKLAHQAETNPRQAAAEFQTMMLAKSREIKHAVAIKHAQSVAANDPDRTLPMQPVPGEAIRAALAKQERSSIDLDTRPGSSGNASPQKQRSWQVQYFHNDHLGTPRELSSEGGEIRWAAIYKAWGNTLTVEYPESSVHSSNVVNPEGAANPAAQNKKAIVLRESVVALGDVQSNALEIADESTHQPLRFQGQYYDNETGLHYNRFRYFDPDCGRFVSQDPIGLAGGDNSYIYGPNASNWIDPLGLAGSPTTATHITYQGVKDGKPYVGYASMQGCQKPEDVLKYRYGSDFGVFDKGQMPKVIFSGYGQAGKDTARGLEQRTFEGLGGLNKTSNKQNPVGVGNGRRTEYLNAADKHKKCKCPKKPAKPDC